MYYFRSFWILFTIGLASATYYQLDFFISIWINNPTFMYIENNETPIKEIPFPMITICPTSQVRKWVYEKYTHAANTSDL